MSKVVSLYGAELPEPGKVNKAALKASKALVKAVKAGEIVGFCATRKHSDRGVSIETAGHVGGWSMVGGALMLVDRLQDHDKGA